MTATLFVCGDVVNTRNEDQICSADLIRIISDSDYAICNLEAPIEGFGAPIIKSGVHIQNKKDTVRQLKECGFDLLLLANNHIKDFGRDGLAATIAEIERNGLEYLGAGLTFHDAYKPLIKEINGLRIGFINACEAQFGVLDGYEDDNSSGYAWINHRIIDANLRQLRSECDFVIVLPHAGLENFSVPQYQWRQRYRELCDLGADLVIASHPHVPQGYEHYKNTLIFYSLGNFYFDRGPWAHNPNRSYAVRLRLRRGRAPELEFFRHYTDTEKRKVCLDESDSAVNIAELCQMLDGPEYESAHASMVEETYVLLMRYLSTVTPSFPIGLGVRATLKELVRLITGKRKKGSKNALLLHLFRNDTYQHVFRTALEARMREK